MTQSLPTADEINPFDDLDGRVAQKNYLGKTLEQVVEMLESNPSYVDDFMWMGPKAFAFYIPAVLVFAARTEDADFISSICGTLEFRLEYNQFPEAARLNAMRLCRLIVTQCDQFEVDSEIYEGIKGRIESLIQKLQPEPMRPSA